MKSGLAIPSYGSTAVWTGFSWSTDYPVTNLSDLSAIRRVARPTSAIAKDIDFVLPASKPVQSVSLVHHNAPYGATWRVLLFSDTNPDPVGNPGGLVHDSGLLDVWPSDPGTILFPRVRPYVMPTAVTARSGQITLNARTALDNIPWEVGGIEIAGWWEWQDVQVPRELGLRNTDTVMALADSVRQGMGQWAPRTWAGSRELVDQTEASTTALDFQRDRGLTKPFVFVWDKDDPTTWAREAIFVRNARLSPPLSRNYNASRLAFSFVEHLG